LLEDHRPWVRPHSRAEEPPERESGDLPEPLSRNEYEQERLDRSGNDLANNHIAPAQAAVKDRVETANRPQTSSVAADQERPYQEQIHPKHPTVRSPQVAKITHVSVICFHQDLETIFYFDFWNDEKDFAESSTVFNQILASTRLLT
jgi:hypothetical protein